MNRAGPPGEERLSPNRSSREGCRIALVVLHYTGMVSAEAALARLCDRRSEVSSHYLIDASGRIHALVPESERAWHAGKSFWAGRRGINAASLGIELAHRGHLGGVPGYPEVQIEALEELLADICRRRGLGPGSVLGHSDIAPTRKRDPGEWFPWRRLAAKQLTAWVPAWQVQGVSSFGTAGPGRMVDALARIGYDTGKGGFDTPAAQACFRAFQRRFRPRDLGCPLTRAAILHAERIAAEWPGTAVFEASRSGQG